MTAITGASRIQAERIARCGSNGLAGCFATRNESNDPSRTTQTFDDLNFRELSVEYDRDEKALIYHAHPRRRPCFTAELLEEIGQVFDIVHNVCRCCEDERDLPVRFLVAASRIEGIFNLGGDLDLFAIAIRTRDEKALKHYARLCIDRVYSNAIDLGLPIVTISLVQGDALGGGFEAAISSDVVIAERSAKFGLPEVLFNLFPGMGAYSLLGRLVTPAIAERMILSGRIYSAEELYDLGVVDVVADDGQGRQALFGYFRRARRQANALRAVHQIKHRVNPISYSELSDVVDLWVRTAMQLGETDLRRMERVAAAQNRRMARYYGVDRSAEG